MNKTKARAYLQLVMYILPLNTMVKSQNLPPVG